MATLVKIRGLDRGQGNTGGAIGQIGRGFRIKSALGKRSDSGTAATLDVGAGNSKVTYTAKFKGAVGNSIQIAHVSAGTTTPLSVVVTYPTGGSAVTLITVNLQRVANAAVSTATEVAAAVNAHTLASQLVTATAGGTGAGTASAGGATPLATGADGTGPSENIFLEANNLNTLVVDVDDPTTARLLYRNRSRWVSLGAQ